MCRRRWPWHLIVSPQLLLELLGYTLVAHSQRVVVTSLHCFFHHLALIIRLMSPRRLRLAALCVMDLAFPSGRFLSRYAAHRQPRHYGFFLRKGEPLCVELSHADRSLAPKEFSRSMLVVDIRKMSRSRWVKLQRWTKNWQGVSIGFLARGLTMRRFHPRGCI